MRWSELPSEINPLDTVVLERSRNFCSEACFTVALQHRRLRSVEPEDETFVFRYWADLQFLIIALCRLRRAAELAQRIRSLSQPVKQAIRELDRALPGLKKMRNIGEHFDSYALDDPQRHDPSVSRGDLQVGQWDGTVYRWLNQAIDVDVALVAAEHLFQRIKDLHFPF